MDVFDATFGVLIQHVPPSAYRNAPVGVSVRVALFAAALGVAAGILFAAIPVWRSTRFDAHALMHRSAATGRRPVTGRAAIALQVSLAVMLTFGAAVATRAFVTILQVPLGFDPGDVMAVSLSPPPMPPLERQALSPTPMPPLERQAFYERAIRGLAKRGDVVSVGAASPLPLDGTAPEDGIVFPGSETTTVGIVHVLAGYFETIRQPLLRGRLLNRTDEASAEDLAVISDGAARVLFPGREALGGSFENRAGRRFRVVGVVADVVRSPLRGAAPEAYVIPKGDTRSLTVVVRTRHQSALSLPEVRRELAGLAVGTPVAASRWTESIAATTAYRQPRFQALILGAFALLAVGLIGLGVGTIVSFLAQSRAREISVRLAMGAAPATVVRLLVGQSLLPVAVGLLIGVAATGYVGRLAHAQLLAVEAEDPMMLVASTTTIVVVAVIAAYLPARQASRRDPALELRAH